MECSGVQRVGGEDQVKISFATLEIAKVARKDEQWLEEPRFREARMLGEQWYPIKVDRVHRSSISPTGTTAITKEAAEAYARENRVKIEWIRKLSNVPDKVYGSVVVFLSLTPWVSQYQSVPTLFRSELSISQTITWLPLTYVFPNHR